VDKNLIPDALQLLLEPYKLLWYILFNKQIRKYIQIIIKLYLTSDLQTSAYYSVQLLL